MASLLRVFCFFLLTACAGCVPHYDRYAPTIEGSVLRNGQPIVGATVELAAGSAMTSVAQTDVSGKFKVGPLKEFHIGIMPFFDEDWAYHLYRLTVQQDGVTYFGFSGSPGYTSDPAQLECELSAPARSLGGEDWYCVVERSGTPVASTKLGECSNKDALAVANTFMAKRWPDELKPPYPSPTTKDANDMWMVIYDIPEGWTGGAPTFYIDKKTCKIVQIISGQ